MHAALIDGSSTNLPAAKNIVSAMQLRVGSRAVLPRAVLSRTSPSSWGLEEGALQQALAPPPPLVQAPVPPLFPPIQIVLFSALCVFREALFEAIHRAGNEGYN